MKGGREKIVSIKTEKRMVKFETRLNEEVLQKIVSIQEERKLEIFDVYGYLVNWMSSDDKKIVSIAESRLEEVLKISHNKVSSIIGILIINELISVTRDYEKDKLGREYTFPKEAIRGIKRSRMNYYSKEINGKMLEDLDSRERGLYIYLKSYSYNGILNIDRNTIFNETSTGERTIKILLQSLEEKGWIIRKNMGRNGMNIYFPKEYNYITEEKESVIKNAKKSVNEDFKDLKFKIEKIVRTWATVEKEHPEYMNEYRNIVEEILGKGCLVKNATLNDKLKIEEVYKRVAAYDIYKETIVSLQKENERLNSIINSLNGDF